MALFNHYRPLDRAACGLPQFTFAGFEFPRYVVNLPRGSFTSRIADHRRPAVTGGYYHAPTPDSRKGWGFYLSDRGGSQFALRWQWADEVEGARIGHNGWYCDEDGGQTIRGIVLRLPHGRGFLAGWSMGEGMASSVDAQVYADEAEAAQAADEEARIAAENEREYQAQQAADDESDEES